jgi:hypothetical protein
VNRGRAIAQAVSRWLPTAAARVWSQAKSCGVCSGHNGAKVGFLRVLRFPLPILIPRLLHIHYHVRSGAGTVGKLVAGVRSGLSLTPPQETKLKNYCDLKSVMIYITALVTLLLLTLFVPHIFLRMHVHKLITTDT